MVRRLGGRWLAGLAAGILAIPATAQDEASPPRDVDAWHQSLAAAIGGDIVDEPSDGWSLGLYPTVGTALGPPNWIAYQLQGLVSLTLGRRLSVFAGYGYERGPASESQMVTAGWGGVLRLESGRPQRGFYGKFLRYRRLRDFQHGIHHGLSVGHESGAGIFGLSVELGASRSPRNHWSFTAQIGLKLAFPIVVPLSNSRPIRPDP